MVALDREVILRTSKTYRLLLVEVVLVAAVLLLPQIRAVEAVEVGVRVAKQDQPRMWPEAASALEPLLLHALFRLVVVVDRSRLLTEAQAGLEVVRQVPR